MKQIETASIFTFSVQFMNRVSHVRKLVDECNYFERMLGCVQRCIDWNGDGDPGDAHFLALVVAAH